MNLPRTPSQTIGPFFALGLPWPDGPFAVPEDTIGAIWVRGTIFDGARNPVADSMVETWQADPSGRFDGPGGRSVTVASYRGFGRSCADAEGRYGILTVKPGVVPAPDGSAQAPHIDVSVFARGLLKRVVTRIYFGDEQEANERDPVLAGLRHSDDRATLIADVTDDGYRFDIHLQGERETVFFDL